MCERILTEAPTNPGWLNNVAWRLATSGGSTPLDSVLAVELARKAVMATGRKDPGILDTLAAACAGTGQFTNAVDIQQEAIALLSNEQEKRDYQARLKLYQANAPFRR